MAALSGPTATLALAMIVRDEAHNLEPWLPHARRHVDELVVVDTGSKDGTLDLLRRVDARIYEYSWENSFARARNQGLDHVRADWILILDADERIEAADWPVIRALIADPRVVAFTFQVKNYHATDDLTAFDLMRSYRLFRNGLGIRYVGAVHNQLAPAIQEAARSTGLAVKEAPIVVHHYGYALGPEAMRAKRERIYRMVRQAVDEHPGDAFYQFHLLSVCHAMGRYREARDLVAGLNFGALRAELRIKALCKAAQVALFFDAHEEANRCVRAALLLAPRMAFLHHLQSQVLYQSGHVKAGIRSAYRAIECTQDDTPEAEGIHLSLDQLLSNLALGYLLGGDRRAAEWHLQQALQINPTNPDARTWLTRLDDRLTNPPPPSDPTRAG
jgi:tetratricopeptide (TPR) repeat protein